MTRRADMPIQSFYGSFRSILNVYVTNRCNLECRHCGTRSGLTERSALALDEVVADAVIDAIRCGTIRALHVSGGEPFLRRRELAKLSDIAHAEGVPLAVNTNGFWASTVQRGTELLESLPGVSQVILSTDVYHAEFLAIERVVKAAEAALAAGCLVEVATVTPFGRRDTFTDRLDALLASAGILGRVRRLFSTLGPTARDTPLDEADLAPWRSAPAPGGCQLINRPTLLEDRTVLACCNTPIAARCADTPLILGRVGETALPDILARVADDPLLKAVRGLGPAFLGQLLAKEGQTATRERYREGDMCTLCTDIMSEPRHVASLRSQLASDALARLVDAAFGLQTGSWPMLPPQVGAEPKPEEASGPAQTAYRRDGSPIKGEGWSRGSEEGG